MYNLISRWMTRSLSSEKAATGQTCALLGERKKFRNFFLNLGRIIFLRDFQSRIIPILNYIYSENEQYIFNANVILFFYC